MITYLWTPMHKIELQPKDRVIVRRGFYQDEIGSIEQVGEKLVLVRLDNIVYPLSIEKHKLTPFIRA